MILLFRYWSSLVNNFVNQDSNLKRSGYTVDKHLIQNLLELHFRSTLPTYKGRI